MGASEFRSPHFQWRTAPPPRSSILFRSLSATERSLIKKILQEGAAPLSPPSTLNAPRLLVKTSSGALFEAFLLLMQPW